MHDTRAGLVYAVSRGFEKSPRNEFYMNYDIFRYGSVRVDSERGWFFHSSLWLLQHAERVEEARPTHQKQN